MASVRTRLVSWLLAVTVCACVSALRARMPPLDSQDIYVCDSKVYCQGSLLDTVQRSSLFDDSKTFVDMPMLYDEDMILSKFEALNASYARGIPFVNLREFVLEHFGDTGQDIEEAELTDWIPRPYVFYKIRDKELRIWADKLNIAWKGLARKVNESEKNSNRSSILYVPNPFIVEGGRFREFYYWDSYWIINGLLVSEMKATARGIIDNFLSLVKRYGFVPNGGRVYYTRRTQPPLLLHMIDSYYEKTKDVNFLRRSLDIAEKEYLFWLRRRTVIVTHKKSGETYGLARYRAESNTPRPEGYREDLQAGRHHGNTSVRRELFNNIASACESGWDFSTRWCRDHRSVATIMTRDIVPVDLNSILCANERLLSKLYAAIGDRGKVGMYEHSFLARREAIHAMMWNERFGVWFDYDRAARRHRKAFYISNLLPLFAQCYDDDVQLSRVLEYINDTGLLRFAGGVPVSLARHAHQQWDFPNAWPPTTHMLIEGLAHADHSRARQMALEMAQTFVSSVYKAWQEHGAMFEKYDVRKAGTPGGGGEYDVQTGFAWTNGVILTLLDRFGGDLQAVPTRNVLFGLTLEAVVCIVTILTIAALVLAGTVSYFKKKRAIRKRRGMASVDDIQYAPVNTSAASSHDNHRDNRENELKEAF